MRKVGLGLFAAAALLVGLASVRAAADGEKQLQNMHGSVDYALPSSSPQAIAPQAAISLADSTTAITGISSVGALTLPDSSRVMLGSETRVQLAFFNQTDIANASFVLYNGVVRFAVEHPQGAHANYTFTTPSATVGVRGTQGDIFSSRILLRVNVFVLSNLALPVQVTLNDGREFDVRQGQTLNADLTQSPVAVVVAPTRRIDFIAFNADFGPAPTPYRRILRRRFGNASAGQQTTRQTTTNQNGRLLNGGQPNGGYTNGRRTNGVRTNVPSYPNAQPTKTPRIRRRPTTAPQVNAQSNPTPQPRLKIVPQSNAPTPTPQPRVTIFRRPKVRPTASPRPHAEAGIPQPAPTK